MSEDHRRAWDAVRIAMCRDRLAMVRFGPRFLRLRLNWSRKGWFPGTPMMPFVGFCGYAHQAVRKAVPETLPKFDRSQ